MSLGIIYCRAQAFEPADIRPVQRHEKSLCQPQTKIVAHFGDALQGRFAWIGGFTGIGRRSNIADAQSGIIVAWSDNAVKIDLDQLAHRGMYRISSPTERPILAAACSSIMTPSSCSLNMA